MIACIPFQLIEQGGSEDDAGGEYNKLLRLARLPRMYRLLRILRLFKMVRILKYNKNFQKIFDSSKMNAGVTRMLRVLVTVLVLVHLVACFWFLLAKFEDFHPETWVVRYNIVDKSPSHQYLISIYWVI